MSCLRTLALKRTHAAASLTKHLPKYGNISILNVRHASSSNGLDFDFDDDGFENDHRSNGSRGFGSGSRSGFGSGSGSRGGGSGGFRSGGNGNSFQSQSRGRSPFDNSFGGQKQMKTFSRAQIEWNKEALVPFTKDFYAEDAEIANMSAEKVQQFRKENKMLLHGHDIPKPFDTFAHSGLPEIAIKHLDKMGISEPSPIQQQGIPMALSGRDVVGISRTGSGKTLAYLLPLIVHIQAQPMVKKHEGPIGLIIAPTRELCLQINEEIEKYIRSNPEIALKTCAVYGGADRHKQIYTLRSAPDILVATPGRLLDLLDAGETNFKRTTYCVLDEADRMLDMGFRDDLECILSYIRPDKQTLMWSATWPKEIQQIAQTYMNDPIRVQIGSTDLMANANIEQCFRSFGSDFQKMDKFLTDMQEITQKKKKCLVFTNTKRTADLLAMKMQDMRIRGQSIHGDKSQQQRERTMQDFRENRLNVLVATDVVSRGIDVADIAVVVCYDFPNDVESYVHRIGRTGRGERKGMSLSYLTRNEIQQHGHSLMSVLTRSNQKVPQFLQQSVRY